MQIDLTLSEQERLVAAAMPTGLPPAEFMKRIAFEHIPPLPVAEDTLDAKLARWQKEDGLTLFPDVSASALFAEWAEEAARMTDEEREAEDRLWEEIERGLTENRGLALRRVV